MINVFYRLVVKGLIVKKYPGFALRDLFWDYDVDEHADKFLIELDDLLSSEKVTVRIKIPRREVKRSLLETMFMLLDNLESILDWYTKEDKP